MLRKFAMIILGAAIGIALGQLFTGFGAVQGVENPYMDPAAIEAAEQEWQQTAHALAAVLSFLFIVAAIHLGDKNNSHG